MATARPRLADLLATLCALLAPPVLSFELARLWGRQNAWLRFATAFNWCQWVIPVIGTLLLVVLGTLAALGLPRTVASAALVLGLVSYGLWLHWFLARHGLGLSRVRAALLVLGVNFGTVLLVLGPRLLALIRRRTGREVSIGTAVSSGLHAALVVGARAGGGGRTTSRPTWAARRAASGLPRYACRRSSACD